MTDFDSSLQFTAIDLSRLTADDLYQEPRPIASWPTSLIRVNESREKTCIASWRRDVNSDQMVSRRLTECVWDALYLGFSYLLCDVISLPQHLPDIAQRLIQFNKLYRLLHAVVAYDSDRDLRRTWIRTEAQGIIMSPTALSYILQRWMVTDIPLAASLTIRQICRKRLGIDALNLARLSLCDTERVNEMKFSDLALIDESSVCTPYSTINLDRRSQAFASDVLLVYEASRQVPRFELIAKLSGLKSNCLAIPSLLLIWALLEGLRVSIRGCDWPVSQVLKITDQILQFACRLSAPEIRHHTQEEYRSFAISGALDNQLLVELRDSPVTHNDNRTRDIWAHGHIARKVANAGKITSLVLLASVDLLQAQLNYGAILEPVQDDTSVGRYTLSFDDDHYAADGLA